MVNDADIEEPTVADESIDFPEPMATRPKYPYSAMMETDGGISLFIVTGNNAAQMLNQGHPVKIQIDEKRLTPCRIKYVYRGLANG